MWWIIASFIVFIILFCTFGVLEANKKDAEAAEAKARIQARQEKIARSPNVTILVQTIVSRWGFPQKIQIYHDRIVKDILRDRSVIFYSDLGIADIRDEDLFTLTTALREHPMLEGKYELKYDCGTSDRDPEYQLESKVPAPPKSLQEW